MIEPFFSFSTFEGLDLSNVADVSEIRLDMEHLYVSD